MLTIQSFKITDKEKAEFAFSIRNEVFVEEQKVSREEEYDEFEDAATHYLVFKDDQPAGTCRWRFTDNGIKLERFAVKAGDRNIGIGSLLVSTVLNDVREFQKLIYLHSQVSAMGLYAKAGFEPVGDLFYEANTPHYKMIFRG
jgi:predicted GNAT family N-acyltransferase